AEAREALAICERANVSAEKSITPLGMLAFFLSEQQRYDESRAVAERAVALARDAGFPEHPEVAKILHNQVQVRISMGDTAGAEQVAREALAIHRRVNGDDHPETGWGLYKLG